MADLYDDRPALRRGLTVMGAAAEIILCDGKADALDHAVDRLHDLERRWSRFRVDSEISALNDRAGRSHRVSTDTVLLVELAQQGWRRTGGRFDPTLLAAVRRAGYDDDLARLPAARRSLPAAVGHHPMTCGRIQIDRRAATVRLPAGAGYDPGGIGKGLGADLVSADLVAAGVSHGASTSVVTCGSGAWARMATGGASPPPAGPSRSPTPRSPRAARSAAPGWSPGAGCTPDRPCHARSRRHRRGRGA